jgi:Icc-related predicted phosphoesterase
MKILAFSDLHTDLDQAARLVEMSEDADLVIGAGDFASMHEGLGGTLGVLARMNAPAVIVPGNNERLADIRVASSSVWREAKVLHGKSVEIGGRTIFGLGGGIPTTPWDWSFDLSEEEAAGMLEDLPEGAILVVHSPPKGHCDTSGSGDHLGSSAILEAIERTSPELVVCGHIHEAWGERSTIGNTPIMNLGPTGTWIDLD